MTSKGEHLMNQSDDLEYQLDTLAIRTGHTRSLKVSMANRFFDFIFCI